MLRVMDPIVTSAIPILPAADVSESLKWWTEVCGFKETFRDTTPPTYAGINRDEAYLHLAGMTDKKLARTVGDQSMVRLAVKDIEAMYAEYQVPESVPDVPAMPDSNPGQPIPADPTSPAGNPEPMDIAA